MTSDIGTTAAPLETDESRCVVPISIMVRTSLMACSFSTAYLLSRFKDLRYYMMLVIDTGECFGQTTEKDVL